MLCDCVIIRINNPAHAYISMSYNRHTYSPCYNHVCAYIVMSSHTTISSVDDAPPWCAEMVVVSKPSGAVTIFVDLTHLNQNVIREYHPLPNIDDTLAQLTVARKFTKLDANSGFWQIPLTKTS